MATTTPSALEGVFFLDTNIFVYAWLQSEPLKKQRAIELLEQALASRQGCISYQVIQEFANVATRKFAKRLSPDECLQFIEAAMQPINRVASSTDLIYAALAVQKDTAYSFYDSLILASALQAGASVLYTEDLQHNQLINGSLRIVNPFLNVAMQLESVLNQ